MLEPVKLESRTSILVTFRLHTDKFQTLKIKLNGQPVPAMSFYVLYLFYLHVFTV